MSSYPCVRFIRALRLLVGPTVIAVLGVVTCAESATAQTKLNDDEMQRSIWSTSYEAIGGGKVQAEVRFNGESGSYETDSGAGSLSNINYTFAKAVPGNATVTGNWSMGGTNGKFTFFIAGEAFSGRWQSGGRSGDWRGRFVSLQQSAAVTYGDWEYNKQKNYYYRKCSFPAGGHQYVIFFKAKPNWVYWYNPAKEVYWSCCPTVNHPKWGDDISKGADLFLIAEVKAKDIEDCKFPDAGDDGANFKKGKTKDKDGSDVDLGCPPPDLP